MAGRLPVHNFIWAYIAFQDRPVHIDDLSDALQTSRAGACERVDTLVGRGELRWQGDFVAMPEVRWAA